MAHNPARSPEARSPETRSLGPAGRPQAYWDNYAAILLDHAAGVLPRGHALLLEVHQTLRPQARAALAELEAVGAHFLNAAPPLAVKAPQAPEEPMPDTRHADMTMPRWPAAVGDLLSGRPEGLAWKTQFPGFRQARIADCPGVTALWLKPGGAIPAHAHEGVELTLVIDGAFEDERGVYGRGDLAIAEPGFSHRPRVTLDDSCLCLVANTGDNKFKSRLARLAARFARLEA
jgi:putative transcriptional regulator